MVAKMVATWRAASSFHINFYTCEYFPSLMSFCLLRNQSGILYCLGFCIIVMTRSTCQSKKIASKWSMLTHQNKWERKLLLSKESNYHVDAEFWLTCCRYMFIKSCMLPHHLSVLLHVFSCQHQPSCKQGWHTSVPRPGNKVNTCLMPTLQWNSTGSSHFNYLGLVHVNQLLPGRAAMLC